MSSQTSTTTVIDSFGRTWKQCPCGAWFRVKGAEVVCSECRERTESIEWIDVTDTYRDLFPTLAGRILIERAAISEPVTILDAAHFPIAS
jgi:hypothetical protein